MGALCGCRQLCGEELGVGDVEIGDAEFDAAGGRGWLVRVWEMKERMGGWSPSFGEHLCYAFAYTAGAA